MFDFVQSFYESASRFPLGDFVIRSTVPLVIAAFSVPFLLRRSAALRHRIWFLGLMALVVVPVAELVLPKFSMPVLPSRLQQTTVVSTGDASATVTEVSIAHVTNPPEAPNDTVNTFASTLQRHAAAPDRDSNPLTQPTEANLSFGIHELLIFGWLVGLGFGTCAFMLGACGQWIQLKRLPTLNDPDWQRAVESASRQLGLTRDVSTIISEEMRVPATVGVLNPRLLVPIDWKSWSTEQRDCILLHELAHIQRWDVASQCVTRIAVLLHWFNPLAWHAARRLRAEREVASDDCVLQTGLAASGYAQQLLLTLQRYRPLSLAAGVAMAHSARLDDRVRTILDPQHDREPVGRRSSLITTLVVSIVCAGLGGVTLSTMAIAQPAGLRSNAATVWKENYAVEYPSALPVSVAFSKDGKKLLTGDSTGEIMALKLSAETPTYSWKTKVGGSHPAVAYALDGQAVYATTTHGVVVVAAKRGHEKARIVEKNSNPVTIDVFPIKPLDESNSWTQIVFGSARGYFVKTWVTGREPNEGGTISTSTIAGGTKPADAMAVPLAVDPRGRSAIMVGPVDGTGQITGEAGRNVLWAYVCGDYDEGSPGNRVMKGHAARVVSAAWSKEGSVAVTGDADGRVIEWNATTMKESHRRELGGRIAALAMTNDGRRIAAYVLGKQGRVFVWNKGAPTLRPQPIHTDLTDFRGPNVFASLDFSPEGNRLAGCAGNKNWLADGESLIGKVRVWNFAASPKQQPAPRLAYVKPSSKANGTDFVVPNNNVVLASASKEGAIDLYDVDDGKILSRIVFGEVPLRRLVLSYDRKWVAIEQLTPGASGETFDVKIRHSNLHPPRGTIGQCQQLLGLSKHGKVAAVIRDSKIELWDTVTSKRIKQAPFKHTRVDAAEFTPDGKLLAISDRNTLVLWQWENDTHEQLDQGRSLKSLAFSPDGRFLAEGPARSEKLRIRDLKTKQIARTLSTGRTLSVPHLTFTQGGRVLIACDKSVSKGQANRITRPRIFMWDTSDGSLAHQLTVSGLPQSFDVSPNELYLVARVVGPGGTKLMGWRLDGKETAGNDSHQLPATAAKP